MSFQLELNNFEKRVLFEKRKRINKSFYAHNQYKISAFYDLRPLYSVGNCQDNSSDLNYSSALKFINTNAINIAPFKQIDQNGFSSASVINGTTNMVPNDSINYGQNDFSSALRINGSTNMVPNEIQFNSSLNFDSQNISIQCIKSQNIPIQYIKSQNSTVNITKKEADVIRNKKNVAKNKESKHNEFTSKNESIKNKNSSKRNKPKKLKDYNAILNINILYIDKRNTTEETKIVLKENVTKIVLEENVIYSDYINNGNSNDKNNEKPSDEKKKNPEMIIAVIVKNVKNADSMKVQQLNKKNNTIVRDDNYPINNGEEKVNTHLYTNQGENKYDTEISFYNGKSLILLVKFKLESTRNLLEFSRNLILTDYNYEKNMSYKNNKKLNLIKDLLVKIGEEHFIHTIEPLFNSKMMNDLLNSMKNKGVNKEMIRRLKERKSMETIYRFISQQQKEQPGLLILCFEYIYKYIIEDTMYRHIDIDWRKWEKFLTQFQLGVNSKNDINILIVNCKNKRKMDSYIVDNERKRIKVNDNEEVASDILNNNSDFGLLIS